MEALPYEHHLKRCRKIFISTGDMELPFGIPFTVVA